MTFDKARWSRERTDKHRHAISSSQVSTASGLSSPRLSSPRSSPPATPPRLDALFSLRTCLPNAAINLGQHAKAKRDRATGALSVESVPQLDDEIRNLLKHHSRQDDFGINRAELATRTGTFTSTAPSTMRLSLSNALERSSQEVMLPTPAPVHPVAQPILDMPCSPSHLSYELSAPEVVAPFIASSSSSCDAVALPPPYVPGYDRCEPPISAAPSHLPDAAPTSCYFEDAVPTSCYSEWPGLAFAASPTSGVQFHPQDMSPTDFHSDWTIGSDSWYPVGNELETAIGQPTWEMQAWTAGASAAEIEEMLRAAQPHVYED